MVDRRSSERTNASPIEENEIELARAAIGALASFPLRTLVTLADPQPREELGAQAANVRVETFVPHSPVLERAALYRRLRAEQAGATEEEAEGHERRALWIVGITFYLLGGYIAFEAVSTLWKSEPPGTSTVGIILPSVSLVVMPSWPSPSTGPGRR